MSRWLASCVSVVLLLAGCRQEPSGSVAAPASASALPPATASSVATGASATPPPAPTPSPAPAVPPLPSPPEKSSVAPTPLEWKKAPEVEIAHAASLGCQAYMIREWIQVVCKERPDTDRPEGLEILRDEGAKKRIITYAKDGRVSVVTALRKGVNAEVAIRWRTAGWGKRTLEARYSEGDAAPHVAFDRGAPNADESPLSLGQVTGEKPGAGRMIQVPAGARKGKDPVEAFLLDETEVTVRAWQACVQAGACPRLSGGLGCMRDLTDVEPLRPVGCVTFEEASTYCAWANKRLPTEKEWWYAFYGTDGRPYPWGSAPGSEHVCSYQEHQWVKEGGKSRMLDLGCKVGSHPSGRGPFGHEDLLANVAEWTTAEKDGKRAAMGGSFGSVSGASDTEYWFGLMKSLTEWQTPDARLQYIGFRCAR